MDIDIELTQILNKVYANEMRPDQAQWDIFVLFTVNVRKQLVFDFVEHLDKSRVVDNIDDIRNELKKFRA